MKIVKICGIKTLDAAQTAVLHGADLTGMILVPNRGRTIDTAEAKKICDFVKLTRAMKGSRFQTIDDIMRELETREFVDADDYFTQLGQLIIENGPFAVAVFRNQPISEVFRIAETIGNDIIQLHGNENKLEYCKVNLAQGRKYGIIPRYVIPNEVPSIYSDFEDILIGGKYLGSGYLIPLLDSDLGGEGKVLDWSLLDQLMVGKYILAGGLNYQNVLQINGKDNIIGFDVSGGVETDGVKDAEKIEKFIINGKSVA